MFPYKLEHFCKHDGRRIGKLQKSKIVNGVIVPLFTPINNDESVCFTELQQLVDYVVLGAVDGIFTMGTSGEFARFRPKTRMRIVSEVVKHTSGRVPVYAGISDCGTKLALENMENAATAGADYIVSSLPYYFPITSDSEAIDYFTEIAERSPVPLLLYNIPKTVGATISIKVVTELMTHDNIVGIKDTSGDKTYFSELIKTRNMVNRRFSILIGDESLLSFGYLNGANGCVPSLANVFPKLLAGLHSASLQNNDAVMLEYFTIVDEINVLNGLSDSWMFTNMWRKIALSKIGIIGPYFTAPCVFVSQNIINRINDILKKYSNFLNA